MLIDSKDIVKFYFDKAQEVRQLLKDRHDELDPYKKNEHLRKGQNIVHGLNLLKTMLEGFGVEVEERSKTQQ